jgi:integrase
VTAATKVRRGRLRRPNGEGTIYRRDTPAGPRWDIELRDESGKRRTRRFGTEREALAALKEAQRRKDTGRQAMPAKHTMAQLFDAWLDSLHQQVERGERSLNTWREYSSYVERHMRAALGSLDCRRLSVKDVEDYLGSLDLAPKTRANHRITLRRALNVALKWGWVDQNVAAHADPIPVRRRELAALSVTDARRLLAALQSDRLYAAYVVAMFTGLRAGELAGLRIEDVNLSEGRLSVHQQVQPLRGQGLEVRPLKTYASAGSLDLTPEVIAVLADQIGQRTEGYVWESAPGRPYWPTSFTHGLSRALQRAGLPHVRLHDLRHYFVSFLPQLDVHPAVAQKLARHATIGTTMNVYTSVEDSLKKQAMGRLHDAFREASEAITGETTGSDDGLFRILR